MHYIFAWEPGPQENNADRLFHMRRFFRIIVLFLALFQVPSFAGQVSLPVRYTSKTADITITRNTYYGTTCYIAKLKLKGKAGYKRFNGGVASSKYGETTQNFARRVNAVFAVSGDYTYLLGYPCVRNGKVYHGKNAGTPAVYSKKTGKLTGTDSKTYRGKTLKALAKKGVISHTFCFGGPILKNGKITIKKNMNQKRGSGRPRAFIGTNGKAGNICIVVTEGADSGGGYRSDGRSWGLTMWQCANVLKKQGCKFGVPLDGGGSVQMVYRGRYVNNADRISFDYNGRPYVRRISDFYYVK